MLAPASFGQTPVSTVRPALGTSSASRERPGRDHPRPLGLVWPCPLVFQPLTLSVGVRAPAPETSSLDVGHDLPRKRKADSTAQDARIPARIRSECRGAQSAWPPVQSDDSTPSPMQQTLAVKRWLTHRVPVSLRVCPRRASPHRGSTQNYAGSASREARAGNWIHQTGNLQPDCQRGAPDLGSTTAVLRPRRASRFTALGPRQRPNSRLGSALSSNRSRDDSLASEVPDSLALQPLLSKRPRGCSPEGCYPAAA